MDEQSEIVKKRMPLFTIQQRYKYYFSCCIFLYMCAFFLLLVFLSALFSHALIYICAFFPVRFFPMCFFKSELFSGHQTTCTTCLCKTIFPTFWLENYINLLLSMHWCSKINKNKRLFGKISITTKRYYYKHIYFLPAVLYQITKVTSAEHY